MESKSQNQNQNQNKNNNKQTVPEIQKKFATYLSEIQNSEKDVKELENLIIEDASEVALENNNKCYLIRIECPNEKDLKKINQNLVKKFEEHFSTPCVIIPAKRRINGKIYQKYQGKNVPRDRTLTALFDGYLDELLYPATIIGKRTRFPKGKVRQFKVFVDHLDKEFIEYKLSSIIACYKALTNRELQIEFPEH